jgi:iron complex outermembrane receptor protein
MKSIFLFASLFVSSLVFSQSTGSVSGTISDYEMNGEPLLYAHVELENTTWTTQTNLNGNFEIDGVALGNYVLAVSFPGYETLKIPVAVEENEMIEIYEGLSAKSLDVVSLLVSDHETQVQDGILGDSRRE